MTRPLVRFQPIPEGDPGALATLTVMRDLVNDATRNPWAVDTARRLVGAAATDDPDDVITRIADRFEEYFRFSYDPAPMDRVSSPVLLLQEWAGRGTIRGDCDDAAVLAAFLGAVQYLPWRFRAVGFTGTGPLTHVYTLLRGNRGWVDLDVTKNPKQVVPAARRYLDFP
jgi:hypothetical protein